MIAIVFGVADVSFLNIIDMFTWRSAKHIPINHSILVLWEVCVLFALGVMGNIANNIDGLQM